MAQTEETLKIMPFVGNPSVCRSCHQEGDGQQWTQSPAKACVPMCVSCHKDMKQHHTVGVSLESQRLRQVALGSKRQITCVSCHDLTRDRFDAKSWKAESLFDGFFRKQEQYKTYYLVVRNNKGQLCKVCH